MSQKISTINSANAGISSAAGSVWYNAAGAPSNSSGNNGDYYLNDSTGDVYNKTNGSWTIVANIKGAAGSSSSTIDWQTKTTNYTAVNGDALFVDTSSAALTVTLPANPVIGWCVTLQDPKGTWPTNNLTVHSVSEQINYQSSDDLILNVSDGVTLLYSGTSWVVSAGGFGSAAATSSNTTTGVSDGFNNKFRNGSMDVWQRGATGTITAGSSGYSADGWIIGCTGANVNWSQVSGLYATSYALGLSTSGAASDVYIKQRIESFLAAPLYLGTSTNVTIQAKIFNNTGSNLTPTLTVNHATSRDNWSSVVTDINAVSLQTCANNTLTTVSYTFATANGTKNGLEIIFDFGALNGSNLVEISELDIRANPTQTTGLTASPPVPELRNIQYETALCQRYYLQSSFLVNSITGGNCVSGITFPTTMRTNPTISGGEGGFSIVVLSPVAVTFYQPNTSGNTLSISAEL